MNTAVAEEPVAKQPVAKQPVAKQPVAKQPVAKEPAATPVPSQADQLFDEGKALLAKQEYTLACVAFAQSNRLDPATGTLLALALCHEGEGKLASAVRAYQEVIARATTEGRADRVAAARESVNALTPKLSRLTIRSTGLPDSVQLRLDAEPLSSAQLGTAVPVDGGEHVVEAWKTDILAWSTRVTVAASADAKTIVVPALGTPAPPLEPAMASAEPVATPMPVAKPALPASNMRAHVEPTSGFTTGQWAGIFTVATGVVGFGVGSVFGLQAISKNDAAKRGCDGDLCTATARQKRLDARFAGNASTVAFSVGAALATVGTAIFFSSAPKTSFTETALHGLFPFASNDGVGTALRGSF